MGKCGRKVWNKVTYFQKNASAVVKIDSATGSCLWVCGMVWVRIKSSFPWPWGIPAELVVFKHAKASPWRQDFKFGAAHHDSQDCHG